MPISLGECKSTGEYNHRECTSTGAQERSQAQEHPQVQAQASSQARACAQVSLCKHRECNQRCSVDLRTSSQLERMLESAKCTSVPQKKIKIVSVCLFVFTIALLSLFLSFEKPAFFLCSENAETKFYCTDVGGAK